MDLTAQEGGFAVLCIWILCVVLPEWICCILDIVHILERPTSIYRYLVLLDTETITG